MEVGTYLVHFLTNFNKSWYTVLVHYSSVGVSFIKITAYSAAIFVALTEICTCFINFWPNINITLHITSSYSVLQRMSVFINIGAKKSCTLLGGHN
jgi:hypothetical protein